VDTNLDFLLDLCNHREFISGNVHTNFIEQYRSELWAQKIPPDHIVIQVLKHSIYSMHILIQKIESLVCMNVLSRFKLRGLSPRANYTNRVTADCW
jgi:hypothetical protein